ncbi:cytochrome c oxidase accessory protein CcoG [uncultured Halovibrio sp.]|uniref:cytochrome c oxidase accessory protein CcoG n=1 Tax=uncultured Halovibrio sp. TaxID=985049 RepID=UPI0025F5B9B2|nr:cytochrome c oxidase accessory protein CcoG [uncultured Halovibrio sp.]
MSDIPVRQVDAGPNPDRIYVRSTTGFYQKLRTVTLWTLMGLYFAACWIQINGRPLVHFDLPERQFHLLGTTFWPQDFFILTLLLIIAAFGLFFVTTLFGRIWCGFTCPQTAWTFIFMWVEEKVEGSRNQRMKLDRKGSLSQWLPRKVLKHALWLGIGFWTGVTFVGYFYPIRELVPDLFTFSVTTGWAVFWIGFFSVATYLNAGWMREKVCLYVCPYARFQSVMFSPDTRTVTYDANRGEPRGPRRKDTDRAEAGLGDCIDCSICVQVCPTGIDIRNGMQYECLDCGLCVDACNQVMDRMGYDRGLIRYATEREVEGQPRRRFQPRTLGYGVAMALLLGTMAVLLMQRDTLDIEVTRDRGGLYQTGPNATIENSYSLKLSNRTNQTRELSVRVAGPEGTHLLEPIAMELGPLDTRSLPAVVRIPQRELEGMSTPVTFEVIAEGSEARNSAETPFIGPRP